MNQKVYSVSGEKISSLIIDEDALKISSQDQNSVEEFHESWTKKLSLATKTEVKFDKIISITNEDNEDEVALKYKGIASISTNLGISFNDENDREEFFHFFEKELLYQKIYETLTPFKAIKNYLIGLVITIGGTAFGYYMALEMANGEDPESHSRKGRIFKMIIDVLGDKGVLLLGAAISAFFLYKIYTRYTNPPAQLKFLPPNS